MRSFRYGRSGTGPEFLQKGEKTGLDAQERQCSREDHAEVETHPGCLLGTEALLEYPCLGDLYKMTNLEVLCKAQLCHIRTFLAAGKDVFFCLILSWAVSCATTELCTYPQEHNGCCTRQKGWPEHLGELQSLVQAPAFQMQDEHGTFWVSELSKAFQKRTNTGPFLLAPWPPKG